MTTTNLLLLDSPEVMLLCTAWPKCYDELVTTEANKHGGYYGAMSVLSRRANLDLDTCMKWYDQLRAAGVLLDGGELDPDVEKYLAAIAQRKMMAASGIDRAKIAAEFLAQMDLDERLDWLSNLGLLEE